MSQALIDLGHALRRLGYRFTTLTPGAQAIVNGRAHNQVARSLRDVFGWNRPFAAGLLPKNVFELMRAGEVLERTCEDGLWRSAIRFSTVDELLLAHSAFPTHHQDAIFLGPDSVRFVNALVRTAPRAACIADVGCGTGVGGIALARRGLLGKRLILSDINPSALRLAQVNAALAGVQAELVRSDVLATVEGDIDLVIANPPYLRDDQHRWYRDGGGRHGEAIGGRIVREALQRLRENPRGGSLLLYTGAAIVDGNDTFLASVSNELQQSDTHHSYEELDPDVFSEELAKSGYADVERIAAVFLQVRIDPRR